MLSVVLCTHNPRRDYLARTLDALKNQTLPKTEWELLVVDNCSDAPLASSIDISWHPNGRVLREEELGLTAARLRGIRETQNDLVVFVDDDNVLDSTYLENARKLAEAWPMLGVWGGRISPEFETAPPMWAHKYVELLAVREFDKDRWSNVYVDGLLPCGAGMCVRRSVASAYSALLRGDSLRKQFGRKGSSLISSEDHDLALTACDLGFGMGQFVSLKLTHLIPSSRLSLNHLIMLREKVSFSDSLLFRIRGFDNVNPSLLRRVISLMKSWRRPSPDGAMLRADLRGKRLAAKVSLDSFGTDS